MEILQHTHSGLRWIVLILLIAAISQAMSGWKQNKPFNRKLALFALISVHTQLLIGLVLYFMGKWYATIETTDEALKAYNRFFKMEHTAGMLVAIILITIGNARAKRMATDKQKHKTIAIFFGIGLLIILACIPWPFWSRFSNLGWF
jgi:hypothetical protein